MSLLDKIKSLKKEQEQSDKEDVLNGEETKDMAMTNFEEMRAKLRAKLQKDKEAAQVSNEASESPVADKPAVKINVDVLKAKLLAKSTAGVKVPPVATANETVDDAVNEPEKSEEIIAEVETVKEEVQTVESTPEKMVKESSPEEIAPPVEATSESETIVETPPTDAEEKVDEEESQKEEKPAKKTKKSRAKKDRKPIVLDDVEEDQVLDASLSNDYDYDTMNQVIDEHYSTSDFDKMIKDFSDRVKNVRIESDMNLGVFKVAQAELVNLRDEIALEHSKAMYSLESTAALVKQITDKNIGVGNSADERKANVAKALSNASIDGVTVDVSFCHCVAKLREQAIKSLLDRIDAKLKACITMSAVLKMEQSSY